MDGESWPPALFPPLLKPNKNVRTAGAYSGLINSVPRARTPKSIAALSKPSAIERCPLLAAHAVPSVGRPGDGLDKLQAYIRATRRHWVKTGGHRFCHGTAPQLPAALPRASPGRTRLPPCTASKPALLLVLSPTSFLRPHRQQTSTSTMRWPEYRT